LIIPNAEAAGLALRKNRARGSLLCGSGVGAAMAANRIPGIRSVTSNGSRLVSSLGRARTQACSCRSHAMTRSILAVPGRKYTFGVVKAAQAPGGPSGSGRAQPPLPRAHLGSDVGAGLGALPEALLKVLRHASATSWPLGQPRSGSKRPWYRCPVARIFTELPPTSITNARLAADARDVAPFAILAHLGFKGAKVFMSLAHRIRARVRRPVAPVSCRTALHHHKWHGFSWPARARQATFGKASLLLTGRTAIGCSFVRRICSVS